MAGPDVLVFGAVRILLRVVLVIVGLAAVGGFVAAVSWLWGNISVSHGYLVGIAIVLGLLFLVIGIHWGVTTRRGKGRNPTSSTADEPPPQKTPGWYRDPSGATRWWDGVRRAPTLPQPPDGAGLAAEPPSQ